MFFGREIMMAKRRAGAKPLARSAAIAPLVVACALVVCVVGVRCCVGWSVRVVGSRRAAVAVFRRPRRVRVRAAASAGAKPPARAASACRGAIWLVEKKQNLAMLLGDSALRGRLGLESSR